MKNKVYDFFISYTMPDKQWALWIARTLEREGYTTIIQAWDFRPSENFVHNMDKALKLSRRFIAVISKAYFKSLYCQAEWTAAFTKDPSMEKAKFIPVRIDDVKPEGLLASVIYIDLWGINEKEAENELLSGVSTKERPRNRSSFPGTIKAKFPGELPFNNLPENRNPHFTGREKLLEDIYNTFEKKEPVALTQAITGLGGIGKTQVALEYAYRYGYEYDCIWWVNAETEKTIFASFQNFALKKEIIDKEIKDAQIIVEAVRNWMQHNNNWLFVYDNAEEFEIEGKDGRINTFRDYLPLQNIERKHILITSRNKKWKHIATVIPLKVFSPEEAAAYLTHRTGQPRDLYQDKLAERLDYLILALAQAGAYICNNDNCDYKEYLSLLEEYHLELFKDSPDMITKQSVHATWDISFKKITNESSRILLNLCAFFAPENINIQWFKSAKDCLQSPLQETVLDRRQYKNAIAELVMKFSLATIKDDNLIIHRLVQEFIRDSLSSERSKWLNCCINILNKLIYSDFGTIESRELFSILITHITTVIGEVSDEDITKDVDISSLYIFMGLGFYEQADYSQSLRYYMKALSLQKLFWGEQINTANTYNYISEVYREMGKYSLALEYSKIALDVFQRIQGEKHPNTAKSYNNIALVYQAQGDYHNALIYYRKALEIREIVLGKEHPDTARSYNNLAVIFRIQGIYEDSLKYYEKALFVFERILHNEHPDIATIFNNIAVVYRVLGDYINSLKHYEKALSIRNKVLGKEHPDTANTYNGIAGVYNNKGEYDLALDYYTKALNIRIKIFGEEHKDTATTYNGIAEVYNNKGEYDLAINYHKKNLYIRIKILGEEHKDTATTYNGIAEVHNNKEEYYLALEYYIKALNIREKVFEKKHPDIANTYSSIFEVYKKIGEYEKAQFFLNKLLSH